MQTQPNREPEGGDGRERSAVGELADTAKDNVKHEAEHAAERTAEHAADSVLERLAEQLEDFAGQLREQDLASLGEHVRATAARSPGLFFAGSVATGLALARFMKASARPESRERADTRERERGEAGRQPQQTPPAPPGKTLRTAPPSPSPSTSTTSTSSSAAPMVPGPQG